MTRAPWLLSMLLLTALALGTRSGASVFGADERKGPGASTRLRFENVGLLYVPGSAQDGGTAVVVSADRILSAAHVLYDESGRLRQPVGAYRFRLGADFTNSRYRESSVARVVALGDRQSGPGREQRDWIVLELAEPAGVTPSELLASHGEALSRSDAEPIEMAGYHADVSKGLRRVSTACRTLAVPADEVVLGAFTRALMEQSQIVLHDCDSGGMSSGAGLFVRRGGRSMLAGLNIGKLGPSHAAAASLEAEHYNIAIAVGPAVRRAIAAQR